MLNPPSRNLLVSVALLVLVGLPLAAQAADAKGSGKVASETRGAIRAYPILSPSRSSANAQPRAQSVPLSSALSGAHATLPPRARGRGPGYFFAPASIWPFSFLTFGAIT